MTITVEPGSRLFRIRDGKGQLHQLSSYLLQEAESGDGVLFPEDIDPGTTLPEVVELRPWSPGGGVRHFEHARLYLTLLRKRFGTLFRRPNWCFVLSPWCLDSQLVVWKALLREAGFQEPVFCSNLELLSRSETGNCVRVLLHWGAGGGDLGACLQQELLSYKRLKFGEGWLIERYPDTQQGLTERREVTRILEVLANTGLGLESGQMIEVCDSQGEHHSLLLETELERALSLLNPVISEVLQFLRGLSAEDQAELFQGGLTLSGGAHLLPLLREALQGLLEIPVLLAPSPARAVLSHC